MHRIHILLVEDNPADIRLVREAIRKGKYNNVLHVVTDGEMAMDFLFKRENYLQAPTPGLILLDLNLPIMNGREVLAEMKNHPFLRRIPVCVLTTSGEDRDITDSYDLHANSFIVKPIDHKQFTRVIHEIESFWLSIVSLPGEKVWV